VEPPAGEPDVQPQWAIVANVVDERPFGPGGEETKRGALRSALLWRFTEQWIARFEGVAAELELQVGQLRTAELAPPEGKKERKRDRR
jgi:hypothetical protein